MLKKPYWHGAWKMRGLQFKLMKNIYRKLAGPNNERAFLIKVYIAFSIFCFAIPAFRGEIVSLEKLAAITGKVALVGGGLVLFCYLEHVWKSRRRKKD